MAEEMITTWVGVTAAALSEDPRAAAVAARRAGFRGVLFDAVSPRLDLTQLTQSGRREFRHVLGGQDQQLAGLRLDLGPHGLGPGADVDRQIARLDRTMEAAKGLAAPLICADLGPLPPAPRVARPKPKVTPEQAGLIIIPTLTKPAEVEEPEPPQRPVDPAFKAQLDGALVEIGRRADRYGVTLALRSELSSFAALKQAILASGCPWFGVDLDPVAVLRDEWALDDVLSELGPLVRHVRGRDATRGTDRRTAPAVVGRGSTDWGELLNALDAAGYHGWLTLDPIDLPDRRSAALAGLEHVRQVAR